MFYVLIELGATFYAKTEHFGSFRVLAQPIIGHIKVKTVNLMQIFFFFKKV